MTAETKTTLINFTLDGKAVSVPKGTTVYQAAKEHGIEIPIFCYQDRMPPFGACRVCLVEVEKMGKLQTSCSLEATEGMVVKTQSQIAKEGREGILELLLINHPLDCPICDRGGECPLQDQTMKDGPGRSRFVEEKRHFSKRKPLGPVLMLDRERCIVCARCTRFGDVVSGDHALEFQERGFKTEVGTPDGGPAESKFIGNTIMICPVGALTSQVYRFRARPWDNQPTKTTCTLCPVGCSEILDSRDGEIMRTRSCENSKVNDIWLCDKGWFGYEFIDHPDRLKQPLIRRNGKLVPATWEEALELVASKIREFKSGGKLAALGGNPLTTEENFLFQQLMRKGAGVNHIDHRVGMPITELDEETLPPGMGTSMGDIESLSFVVILGADITEEFPVLWLRLKQAINKGATVIFIGHYAPEVARHLSKTVLHPPGKEMENLKIYLPQIAALAQKGRGAVFVGRQYLANQQRDVIVNELIKLQKSNSNLTLDILEGRGNSMGARFAGMRPDLQPMNLPVAQPGLNAQQIIEEAAQSGWDFLYVAGSNPAVKYASKLWKTARNQLKFLVVQDLFLTESAQQADVVLPSLCYVEKEGHFINIQGQSEPIHPGKELPENIYSDGEIFAFIAEKLGIPLTVDHLFSETLSKNNLAKVIGKNREKENPIKAAPVDDYALLATFAHALFDHGTRMKHDAHLIKMAKTPYVRIHPLEGIKRHIENDETVLLTANGNEIRAKVFLDEAVAVNTIVLPLGFPEIPVHDLSNDLLNGFQVQIRK